MNSSVAVSNYITDLLCSCLSSPKASAAIAAWFSLYLLLSPLFFLVLYVGFTKWWRQRSSVGVSLSHCDVFTFHMMAVEVLRVGAGGLFLSRVYSRATEAFAAGVLFGLALSGQVCFHCLTCGEHYLAVVHPITYLRLKKRGGVTIRNMCVFGAWLLTVVYTLNLYVVPNFWVQVMTHLVMITLILATVTFCSVSVLCALVRPAPGDRNRKRMDQSKRSALTTIMAILSVLLMRMVQLIVVDVVYALGTADLCVVSALSFWASLPTNLVLPLLFLHRAGKLATCC